MHTIKALHRLQDHGSDVEDHQDQEKDVYTLSYLVLRVCSLQDLVYPKLIAFAI